MIEKSCIRCLAIVCLTSLWPALVAARALDLTPLRGFREGNEGPPTPVVQFIGEKGKIDFQPPQGWQASGGGDSVSFVSPDVTQAWMKLIAIEKVGALPQGDTKGPKEDLQAWAAKFIPAGAEKVEFVKRVPSPFMIETRESTEFIFTFVFFGFRDLMSVSVVDLSKTERLVMLVSADSKNFDRIRQQAIASMFSWSSGG